MRVLVLGGNRFIGLRLVRRLLCSGHEVTVLNRGSVPDPFEGQARLLTADRRTAEFGAALRGRSFDAVVDFSCFDGGDAHAVVEALGGRVGHYVMISSGQVYLVMDGYRAPAREADYDGPVMAEPKGEEDRAEWRYGVDKRAAEDAFVQAWQAQRFPSTRLRLPMVLGPRDPHQRIHAYLHRVTDGGPLLLPDGEDGPARHVHVDAVVRGIVALLGNEAAFGQVYNLTQDDVVTVGALVRMLVDLAGGKNELTPVTDGQLAAAGLRRAAVSPFSNRWMSCLDPLQAKLELEWAHEPLAAYLPSLVAAFFDGLPSPPPPGYERRAAEREVARRARG